MVALMSYKIGSASGTTLAEALGIRRVRANGSFRNNYHHPIINWGSSMHPSFPTPNGILNDPSSVGLATNKLRTFQRLTEHEVPTLDFTTDYQSLESWRGDDIVFARRVLSGHKGNGIVVVQPGEDIPHAPLYTKFFDKTREFRVHTSKSDVFDFTAKLRRNQEEADPYIFNHDNGRVFCRGEIELPSSVRAVCIDTIRALGLDFGAIDVGIDSSGNVAVFEVNTACALEGTTIQRYKETLGVLLEELRDVST